MNLSPTSVPASTHQPERRVWRFGALFVCLTSALLVYRFYWVVARFSVNLFFFDEWDVYEGLFRGWPWWRIFLQEHGPHRQGLGVAGVAWLLQADHWDSRIQAYAIATAIVLAMSLAFWLKRKVCSSLQFWDVIIPILFLGLGQWEILLSAPGPSAQAFPLLLLVVYCLAWIQQKSWLRYGSVVICNFLLIYTGYGIFVVPLTLGLLTIDCWHTWKAGRNIALPLSALIASALSFKLFFYKYVFNPAAACYQFPYHNPAAYPWFMALMLARFLGFRHGHNLPGLVGLVVLSLLIVIFGRSLWALSKRLDRPAIIALILTGYTLIYASAAAIGRVCMGMEAASSSRNLTLLIPGFLGIYFYLLTTVRGPRRSILISAFLIAVIPGCIQRNHREIEGFSAMKRSWKSCYLASENVARCNEVSHLQLYPAPEATHLREKLSFLKKNGLNLYANRH